MSYAKKDEDAEPSGFKQDRTIVFQDGKQRNTVRHPSYSHHASTIVQFIPNFTTTMSSPSYTDSHVVVERREVPYERSHNTLLQHIEIVPEQRSLLETDGLLDIERAFQFCRRHNHVHEYHHEGYDCWQ